MGTLAGGAAAGYATHSMGGGGLASVGAAIVGAIGGNKLEDKFKDKKKDKKHKKEKKHGHHKRRGSGSSSSSSDSD